MRKARPLVCLTDPRKSSVPYRVQLDKSQILWLLANPFLAHGIGESGPKTIAIYLGAADSNQILWFNTNPFNGSLLHPS